MIFLEKYSIYMIEYYPVLNTHTVATRGMVLCKENFPADERCGRKTKERGCARGSYFYETTT